MEQRELQRASAEGLRQRVRIGYTVELGYQVESPAEFIFNLHAARTPQQRVIAESFVVTPEAPVTLEDEPANGNRLARLSASPGALCVRYTGTVEISQYMIERESVVAAPLADIPAGALRFLLPSRYCQVDRVQALAWQEFGELSPGCGQVDAVCAWVRARTKFQPGTSSINTSALETLEHRAGVCRDFAHLTIALLRALNYPTRFVTGVDYGAPVDLGPPDFHAYVEVFLDDRWYLFDPTDISPVTGLLRIGTGRDAADVSFATMFGTVRSGIPRVAFAAAEDPASGIVRPAATQLAVSTAVE
jgi:transglutaminase-like putative cysteine protease